MDDAPELKALLRQIGSHLAKTPRYPDHPDGLLVQAEDMLVDLGIRLGMIEPPRTVRLADLPAGPVGGETDVGTMDQLSEAIGKVVEEFRAEGATVDAIIEALNREATALEDQRGATP